VSGVVFGVALCLSMSGPTTRFVFPVVLRSHWQAQNRALEIERSEVAQVMDAG